MNIKNSILSLLSKFGYALVKESVLYDWQKGEVQVDSYLQVPDEAKDYLHTENPRLKELKQRYNEYQSKASTAIVWTDDYVKSTDLLSFRGDNCYVWQTRDPNCAEINYCLTAYYVQSKDALGLFQLNKEDGQFGAHTFSVNSLKVSRDLLDSINELNFLEREINISQLKDLSILDIGAGYGRLAFRTSRSLDNLKSYICTDAVPESTFISEYHVGYRKISDKVRVVPLDEIEAFLKQQKIDIAFNIHSFSECSLEAIDWWVSLLSSNKVATLFIVPNGSDHGGIKLALNSGEDFSPILEKYGYRLTSKTPKYLDPLVQKYGVSPTHYYIYNLKE